MVIEKKMINESDDEILYLTAKLYFEKEEKVHLVLKAKYPDGKNVYSNCMIKCLRPDFILIEDAVHGIQSYFFVEIKSIEKFKELERNDGSRKAL